MIAVIADLYNLSRSRLLMAVAGGHFTLEIFANLLPIMFPFLVLSLRLSYTQVGVVVLVWAIFASLTQPVFGYLADRTGGRHIAALALGWLVIMMALIANSWNYPVLLLFAALGGLGSAAYHPQAAMHAASVRAERKTTAVSIFSLGGATGFALGPVVGATIFGFWGLGGTAYIAPVGLAVAVALLFLMAPQRRARWVTPARLRDESGKLSLPIVALALVVVVVMLRAWAYVSLTNFLPLLYQERGYSVVFSSRLLFVVVFSGALGAFFGGILADRIGKVRTTIVSLALSAPLLLAFVHAPVPWAFVLGSLTALFLESSMATTIVMSQELMPRNVAMASGLSQGFGFATGGAGVALTGFLADHLGLTSSLSFLAVLPLLAGLFCLRLRKPRPAPAPAFAFGRQPPPSKP